MEKTKVEHLSQSPEYGGIAQLGERLLCKQEVNGSIQMCIRDRFDPTIDELCDIKTAVSEAVTNCIVHAYRDTIGMIYITVKLYENGRVSIKIRDRGCGIPDVEQAMQPLYTTGGEERAGLGLSLIHISPPCGADYSGVWRALLWHD